MICLGSRRSARRRPFLAKKFPASHDLPPQHGQDAAGKGLSNKKPATVRQRVLFRK